MWERLPLFNFNDSITGLDVPRPVSVLKGWSVGYASIACFSLDPELSYQHPKDMDPGEERGVSREKIRA